MRQKIFWAALGLVIITGAQPAGAAPDAPAGGTCLMPYVIHHTIEAATAALAWADRGITIVGPETGAYVVAQDPAAGSTLCNSDYYIAQITLTTKPGRCLRVPNVVGRRLSDARGRLTSFVVNVDPDAKARDVVASQSPSGGELLCAPAEDTPVVSLTMKATVVTTTTTTTAPTTTTTTTTTTEPTVLDTSIVAPTTASGPRTRGQPPTTAPPPPLTTLPTPTTTSIGPTTTATTEPPTTTTTTTTTLPPPSSSGRPVTWAVLGSMTVAGVGLAATRVLRRRHWRAAHGDVDVRLLDDATPTSQYDHDRDEPTALRIHVEPGQRVDHTHPDGPPEDTPDD